MLALVSLGTVVESVALLAISSQADTPVLASGEWALVRVLPLAGALGMSALVVRRVMGSRN